MNDDDQMTAGPSGPAGAQDDGSRPHLVTSLLTSDAVILMLARRALGDGPGSPEALLAARRVLDGEVRALLPWPSGQDYARAASHYESLGRPGDAALLRRVAATDEMLAGSARQWNHRYDNRPPAPAQHLITALHESGYLHITWDNPFHGTDGARYQPGSIESPDGYKPVLVISGRGGSELIMDWDRLAEVFDWVATRGTTAAGRLTPPPVPGECRAWQEDQLLAYLVTEPREAGDFTAGLPADTFTTDVRYEVYQAIAALAQAGHMYEPEDIAAALATRVAAAPDHALPAYGGPGGPFLTAYLDRLATTYVSPEEAAATTASLTQEDQHFRALAVSRLPAPETPAVTQAIAGQQGAPSMTATQPTTTEPGATQPAFQRPGPPASPDAVPGPQP